MSLIDLYSANFNPNFEDYKRRSITSNTDYNDLNDLSVQHSYTTEKTLKYIDFDISHALCLVILDRYFNDLQLDINSNDFKIHAILLERALLHVYNLLYDNCIGVCVTQFLDAGRMKILPRTALAAVHFVYFRGRNPRRGLNVLQLKEVQYELNRLLYKNPKAISERMLYKVGVSDIRKQISYKIASSRSNPSIGASLNVIKPSMSVLLVETNNHVLRPSRQQIGFFNVLISRISLFLLCNVPFSLALVYMLIVGSLAKLFKLFIRICCRGKKKKRPVKKKDDLLGSETKSKTSTIVTDTYTP